MNKIKYSWEDFDTDIAKLAKQMKPFLPFMKNIYGIPRGGLVVAVALSHRLGLPIVLEDDVRKITEKTLVVDDIVDTGETMNDFIARHSFYKTAVLVWNGNGIEPSFWGRKNTAKDWVIFPYETRSSSKYDNK
jgi:hypoxanthine phosphoribosyltransferase